MLHVAIFFLCKNNKSQMTIYRVVSLYQSSFFSFFSKCKIFSMTFLRISTHMLIQFAFFVSTILDKLRICIYIFSSSYFFLSLVFHLLSYGLYFRDNDDVFLSKIDIGNLLIFYLFISIRFTELIIHDTLVDFYSSFSFFSFFFFYKSIYSWVSSLHLSLTHSLLRFLFSLLMVFDISSSSFISRREREIFLENLMTIDPFEVARSCYTIAHFYV